MKLFDRFSCKTSNSAVYVPISVAVCIFLASFWATSSYAFAAVSLQTRGSNAPTSRHTMINSSVHAPVREGARLNNANWRLAFDDEFSGPSVNTNIWNVEDNSPDRYQNGSLNTGIQYYQKEALSLSDGALHIQTNNTARADKQYTSGALTT